jgi:hypothetical protein
MLDLAGIMFSSVMILFIIINAVRLDRVKPWFQTISRTDSAGNSSPGPWRRHS